MNKTVWELMDSNELCVLESVVEQYDWSDMISH